MAQKGNLMAKGPNKIDQHFAEKLFKYGRERQMKQGRVPEYSRSHPVVPQLYVQEWKTDMKNRKLIVQNAELGGVPHYEHDENLYLDKREQMHYNVEDRTRIESKYPHMDRAKLLRPDFHHETSKYQSELMFRRDAELVNGN